MDRNGRRGKSHSSSSSTSRRPSNSTKFAVNPNSNADLSFNEAPITVADDNDNASVNSIPCLIGTCPFMCPDEERAQRERLQDLAVFERLNGNHRKSSSSLAVKKFCRTISTKHMPASDVRPLPVLEDTLDYLLSLLDSKAHSFEVVHDFVFDRTRSIRQDLSMQNIIGDRVINMYEKMVKFHVISHHKLQRCNGSPNVSPLHHLNLEQLKKTLTSLYNLYEANRKSLSHYKNEAEFRSLYVLLNLGSNCLPMGESLSLWLRQVPSAIIKSKEMCFARKVLRYFRMGNYKSFICSAAAESSYQQFCIIEPYVNEIRMLAISSMNYGGYKLHPYPLADLSKLLMMKDSDVESFCNDCGLEIITDEFGMKFLPVKQTGFHHPKGRFQSYCISGSERVDSLFAEEPELR